MKSLRLTLLSFGAILCGAMSAQAGIVPAISAVENPLLHSVEADCFAIGEDKAAELGGKLAKAEPDTKGGAPVCRIVVIVPGAEGERPKREEIIVPQ